MRFQWRFVIMVFSAGRLFVCLFFFSIKNGKEKETTTIILFRIYMYFFPSGNLYSPKDLKINTVPSFGGYRLRLRPRTRCVENAKCIWIERPGDKIICQYQILSSTFRTYIISTIIIMNFSFGSSFAARATVHNTRARASVCVFARRRSSLRDMSPGHGMRNKHKCKFGPLAL